jgi:hypothetical protein
MVFSVAIVIVTDHFGKGGCYMDKLTVGYVLVTIGVICAIATFSGDNESSSDYQHHSYKRSTSSTYSSGLGSTSYSGTSKQTTNSSAKSSSKSSYKSYDKGYEDVYEDDDYDLDRYNSDSDYASGVDDAIDDYEEEEGEDW